MSQSTSQLVSIGAFSRRSRLSLKALRLYDRLRLLQPAYIDPESGYRCYSETQVEAARLIALLRRLRMPLERIGRVIDLPAEEAAAELRAFWAEVEGETEFGRRLVAFQRVGIGTDGRGVLRHRLPVRERAGSCPLTDRRGIPQRSVRNLRVSRGAKT